jgi:hypothetical protein
VLDGVLEKNGQGSEARSNQPLRVLDEHRPRHELESACWTVFLRKVLETPLQSDPLFSRDP